MGAIKPTELANGNIGLEITYGGLDAPFGGIDSSMPPAYIDPKCFVASDGFIIVDNKLVAGNLQEITVPTLWGGTAGVQLLGFGNFYTQGYGTLNYALGYTSSAITGPPSGVTYNFFMTAWVPAGIGFGAVFNDTLSFNLYNSTTPATTASLTLQLLTQGSTPFGTGATVSITAVQFIRATGNLGNTLFPGELQSISVSGGAGYQVGQTYYVQQGNNITGQVTITSVSGSGAITGVSIVAGTYTINWDGGAAVNSAGLFYTVGSANLVQTTPLEDVELKVVGPGGTNTYIVPVEGDNTGLPVTVPSGFSSSIDADSGASGAMYELAITGGTGFQNGFYSVAGKNHGGTGAIFYATSVNSDGSVNSGFMPQSGTGYTNGDIAVLTPLAIPSFVTAPADILNYMSELINGQIVGTTPDPNVGASVNISTGTITLKANFAGTIGNTISVQDLSVIIGSPGTFYYYFPCRAAVNLTGGTNTAGATLPLTLDPHSSITSVGGTLYIANIGPAVIKYGGPGAFALSSTYEGMRVIRKFAGSLIGLGMLPAPSTVIQSADMIFLWSAAQALDTWNPTNAVGNVTGAGFEQLDDIGEYLTGLIVTNATAFIIRSRGISYATATGSGTLPFDVNHISLGSEGEGGQITRLVCQYDQTGMFIGNSDVFQISTNITPVGSKIKQMLASRLVDPTVAAAAVFDSVIAAINVGGDVFPLALFLIGNTIFSYNASNGTWMQHSLNVPLAGLEAWLGVLATADANAASPQYNQTLLTLAVQQSLGVYNFYYLQEGVADSTSLSDTAIVVFPQEEVAFGRDVTVDSLYVALWADVSEDVTITFYITLLQTTSEPGQPAVYVSNRIAYATLTLTPAQFSSLNGVPIEMQVFSTTQGAGAVTGHSPQLSVGISSISDTGTAQIRFSKLQMYCSYDPKQRPV